MNKLMTRDEFRNSVFKRDNYKCIICRKQANEAHHIIERKLWKDEGYYLNNGSSLCNFHHQQAENNTLCPQYIRYILQLETLVPKKFDNKIDYDKWGKQFDMPREYNFKYPTTWYLPFSPSVAHEDKRNKHLSIKHLIGIPLVISIKMDGSNSRIEHEKVAARNGFQADHVSFDLLKSMHRKDLMFKLPENLIIFGEWIYAQHSIHYRDNLALNSYFQCFSIYDRDNNIFLDWNETKKICKELTLSTVPVVEENKTFKTEWEMMKYLSNIGERIVKEGHEGIVVRSAYGYHFSQHKDFVLKYVRENHVQTDKLWSHKPVVKNILFK